MKTRRASAALAVALGFLVAGCVGSDPKPTEDPLPSVAQDAEHDETTGAIKGFVLDFEAVPVPGAGLFLQPGDHKSLAAQDGGYTFSWLQPGRYQVLVGKTGYVGTIKSVDVRPNAVTQADVQIERILPKEPRREILQTYSGYMQCRMSTTPMPFIGGTSGPCGFLPVIGSLLLNTLNPWTEDQNRNYFRLAGPDWQEIIIETRWTPSSVATNPELQIVFSWQNRSGGHSFEISGRDVGYVKLNYTNEGEGEPYANGQPRDPNHNMTLLAFMIIPFGSVNPNNVHPVNLAFELRYEMIVTIFYNQRAPPDFSAFET